MLFDFFQVFKRRGQSLDWCRASCCCFTLQLSWSFCADVRLLATLSTVGWSVAGASVRAQEHLVGPCTEHLVGFWSACPPSVCPAFGCPHNGPVVDTRAGCLRMSGVMGLFDTRTNCPPWLGSWDSRRHEDWLGFP